MRLRELPLVIGRTDGKVRISHDDLVSDRHVEISWQQASPASGLILKDLASQDGTFVKVHRARLKFQQEIRLGAGRYLWREPGVLVELVDGQRAREVESVDGQIELGRDELGHGLSLAHDVFVSAHQARIHRDDQGRWMIEDLNSQNGTWLRVESVPIPSLAEFMLGEQRFRLLVPS